MSDERLPGAVHRAPALILATVLPLLCGSALLAIPVWAHDDGGPGHGHVFVAFGNDSQTALREPDDQVTYRFRGTLLVQEAPDGTAELRLALPAGVRLQEFVLSGGNGTEGTEATIDDRNGTRYAVLRWTADPPAIGTAIDGVHMTASTQVDARASFQVEWPRVGDLEDLDVRVEVPAGYTLTGDHDLSRGVHGPSGRVVWVNIDLDRPSLAFTVRPSFTGPDPAFSDPPSPASGFLLVAAIALVTGTAWYIGKRLELRREREEEGEA